MLNAKLLLIAAQAVLAAFGSVHGNSSSKVQAMAVRARNSLQTPPQDELQARGYPRVQYDAYMAASSQQDLQQKIKLLENFVKQYPNSGLIPYVYRDHYLTDYALKHFAETIEYADRLVAIGNDVDLELRLDALAARAQAYVAGMDNKTLLARDIVVQSKARDAATLGLKMLHDWKKPDRMPRDQFAHKTKSFKALFNSVHGSADKAVAAASLEFSMQAPILEKRMAETEAIENKTRSDQAEFELRKKQAADLGLKPGSAEYLQYVSAGKVSNVSGQTTGQSGQATVHFTSLPTAAEIYVDGKFFGNTPSDITLAAGEHVVRVAIGGKEWTRTLQVTGGEIRLNANLDAQ